MLSSISIKAVKKHADTSFFFLLLLTPFNELTAWIPKTCLSRINNLCIVCPSYADNTVEIWYILLLYIMTYIFDKCYCHSISTVCKDILFIWHWSIKGRKYIKTWPIVILKLKLQYIQGFEFPYTLLCWSAVHWQGSILYSCLFKVIS